MRDNKGWDFLTAFEDIDEKYIYQAAKPWKENKIVRVKRYIRVAAACIILVAAIGGGLTHQNEVKAAWYKMTSLIGRILGIEKETDEYVKTIQKTRGEDRNGALAGKNGMPGSYYCTATDGSVSEVFFYAKGNLWRVHGSGRTVWM